MARASRFVHCLCSAAAVAAAALPSGGAAVAIEPLPGSPFFVGSTHVAFAAAPARGLLFGFTPSPDAGTIRSYPLPFLPLPFPPSSSVVAGATVAGGVASPAGDFLYAGTPTGVKVFAVSDGGALALQQELSRDGVDARPLKGLAYVTAAHGSFVYVNENTSPTNHVAIYRVAPGGGVEFVDSVPTGDRGNYSGGGAASGIPSTSRIGYAGGRLFVLNGGSPRAGGKPASVSVFDVDDLGGLTPVTDSPFQTAVYAQSMLVSPDGAAVYLGSQATPTPAAIVRFAVDAQGKLSGPERSYELPGGSDGAVNGFALHPSGRFLVTALYLTSHLAILDLDTGVATGADLPPVGNGYDVAFDASGDALYVSASGFIVGYRFGEAPPPPSPPKAICVGAPESPAVLVAAPGACSVAVDASNGLAGSCAPGEGEAVACYLDWMGSDVLALGDHAVTVYAKSSLGLTDQCTSFVRVVEVDPPALALAPSPAVLWPPDHRMAPVDLGLSVGDACDPAPAVSCTATSSEPAVAEDVAWDGTVLSLRAERSGGGPGRTYTISCTATDASSNAASTSAAVVVPHDLGVR